MYLKLKFYLKILSLVVNVFYKNKDIHSFSVNVHPVPEVNNTTFYAGLV